MNQSDPARLEHLRRIAPAGGKARAKKLTKRRRSEISRNAGQISGSLRMKNISAEERTEIARKAAKARWKSSDTRQRSKKAPAQRRKRA